METASFERSITRLPPSTGFYEPLPKEPAPELAPVPEAQPARISGTTTRAAAVATRTFLFITFLGCHERRSTQPARGGVGRIAAACPGSLALLRTKWYS